MKNESEHKHEVKEIIKAYEDRVLKAYTGGLAQGAEDAKIETILKARQILLYSDIKDKNNWTSREVATWLEELLFGVKQIKELENGQ